jgi:hypothetical protein
MFQHVSLLCSSVFAFVLQHLCLHLCCSICVCFQQSCFSNYVFSICDSAFVFQYLRFTFVLQHLFSHLCCSSCVCFQQSCFSNYVFSICDSAFVFQYLRFTFVLQLLFSHLCCSSSHLCCGSLHLYCSVFQHLFFNRLPSMTTLIICVISVVAIFPTISPFGIDGNMSFISPPLTSRAKG